jgi:outer membrane lipoprotein-sorting protein
MDQTEAFIWQNPSIDRNRHMAVCSPNSVLHRRSFSMRRLLPLLLAVLLDLPAFTQDMTADKIIAKNIQARGGIGKLAEIKTVRATYSSEEDGKPVRLVELQKRPNKLRRDILFAGNTIVFAFDGKAAWQSDASGKGPNPAPDDLAQELKEEADIDGSLVNYKEKGSSVELVGKEKSDGTDVYNLKITLKEGPIRNIYIDAGNFLEVKETGFFVQRGKRVDFVTVFKNYRPVQGILFPFLIEQKTGDEETQRTYLKKVEINLPVTDSTFTMPTVSPGKTK